MKLQSATPVKLELNWIRELGYCLTQNFGSRYVNLIFGREENNARQQYVCVMCFTAYLKGRASYRAFCVFLDSIGWKFLPEVLSSGLKQIRHLKLQ